MGAFKLEGEDMHGHARTLYWRKVRVSKFLDDLGGVAFKLFDTSDLQSPPTAPAPDAAEAGQMASPPAADQSPPTEGGS